MRMTRGQHRRGSAPMYITFSLCLSVARIDTPPLQPASLVFVSYGFVLARVRVIGKNFDCEPVFFTVVYLSEQTNVARGASLATIQQYMTSVQLNLLWANYFGLM